MPRRSNLRSFRSFSVKAHNSVTRDATEPAQADEQKPGVADQQSQLQGEEDVAGHLARQQSAMKFF